MKKLLLVFLLLFSILPITAQTWVVFNTLNSPLPNNNVSEIKQDQTGNYWVATMGGLAKYDINGNWAVYTTSNSNITSNAVTSIAIDNNNKIWIGYSYQGISSFNGISFTNYDLNVLLGTSPFSGSGRVYGMDFDSNNTLWIATYNGLIKYNGTAFTRFHTGNGLIGPNNRVWSVLCDKTNNNVWAGTFDAGLLKFNGANFSQYFFYDTSLVFLGGLQQVNQIYFDQQGDIWVTGYGVIEFDKNTMAQKSFYNSNNGLGDALVWGIAIDQGNKLWVGSDYLHGLFMQDGTTWYTLDSTNSGLPSHCHTCSLPTNNVDNVLVDQYNNKWFSTLTGVVIYRESGVILSGIHETKSINNKISVYPNPTSSIVNINAQKLENDNYEIIVKNILGQVLKKITYKVDANFIETQLDIEKLEAGTYFLIIESDKKSYASKIIKN